MTMLDVWQHFSEVQLQEHRALTASGDKEACARYKHTQSLQARKPHASPSCRSFLAEVLGLEGWRFQARDAIKLDYACYILE